MQYIDYRNMLVFSNRYENCQHRSLNIKTLVIFMFFLLFVSINCDHTGENYLESKQSLVSATGGKVDGTGSSDIPTQTKSDLILDSMTLMNTPGVDVDGARLVDLELAHLTD